MKFDFPVLIGDIGGTNARFAMVRQAEGHVDRFEPVRLSKFSGIDEAIHQSVLAHTQARPATTLLAIATPLVGDVFRLTNAPWTIDPRRMLAEFSLKQVLLMNDFAAQGLATLALGPEHLAPLGGGPILENHPKVAVGPGTGLGIANIVNVGGKWAVIPGEGGHIDLGPRTAREMAVWPHLAKEKGRMSAELALSGRGLENLYGAICATDGHPPATNNAAEISRLAMETADPQAREAVMLFVTLFARVAGDMALLTLARGGIYVAGGILQKLLPMIDAGQFRAVFEDKAPHEAILQSIPVNVMTHPTAALEGLVAWVRHPERFSLEGATRSFAGEDGGQ